jgi:hypothetical protein
MARFTRSLVAALGIAALSPLALVAAPHVAFAQGQPASAPDEPLNQVQLSDAQVQAYLAAAAELAPILAKMPQEASDKPDPKAMAQLDAIAKKYKFASFEEFDGVAETIGLVTDGVDPQTKKYVGAEALLKQQIAEVQADAKMPAADKKEALAELNGALKGVAPVKFPGNIDIVLKYYDKIIAIAPQPSQEN